MKTEKLIIFNLLVFLASINVLYLYFAEGMQPLSLTEGYILSITAPFFTILILFLCSLMVNLGYVVSYAKSKKNLFRIPMFIMGIVLIISIIQRIREIIDGYFCFTCILNTVLYLIIFIMIILILKDLYTLVRKLFAEKQ